MTREDAVRAPQGPAPVTFVNVAALFGRLVGLALILGVAMGLLLTAAAVALPAPSLGQEMGPDRATSGRFLMRRSGEEPWVPAPTLATEVRFGRPPAHEGRGGDHFAPRGGGAPDGRAGEGRGAPLVSARPGRSRPAHRNSLQASGALARQRGDQRSPRHALRVPAPAREGRRDRRSRRRTGAGDTRLTLVTCYPFDAIRPGGPLRYVVVAASVDG